MTTENNEESENPLENLSENVNLSVPRQQVFNWMTGYAETIRQDTVATKKDNPVIDEMEGGWRKEGKEKPQTPLTCTKCQWVRRNDQQEEPDRGGWCRDCLDGKLGPGHEVKGVKPTPKPDSSAINTSFFG